MSTGALRIAVFSNGGLRGGQAAVLLALRPVVALDFAGPDRARVFRFASRSASISSVLSIGFGVSHGANAAFYVGHVAVLQPAGSTGRLAFCFADVCKGNWLPSSFSPLDAPLTQTGKYRRGNVIRWGMNLLGTGKFRPVYSRRRIPGPTPRLRPTCRFDLCRTEKNWPPCRAGPLFLVHKRVERGGRPFCPGGHFAKGPTDSPSF